MQLRVININTKLGQQDYNAVYNKIDRLHPYYGLDFIETFSLGLNNAKAFICECTHQRKFILMPFYLRHIGKDLSLDKKNYDITSTYGYSGPLYNGEVSSEELKSFWKEIDQWSKDNDVVSEFIRFNLSGNHLGYSGTSVATLKNVKGELLKEELIWKNYEHKVRKNVKRAINSNLVTKIYKDNIPETVIEQFYSIYVNTMKRLQTKEHFYFGIEDIKVYIKKNSKHCAIALTYLEELPISCELLLLSKSEVFSFLGGTESNFFKYRPNDLLKHEVIKWAYNLGFKYYVLGGGFGKEDGIFKYKKSFFPNDISTYYTGRKILNKEVYIQLALLNNRFNEAHSMDDTFFPAYRKE